MIYNIYARDGKRDNEKVTYNKTEDAKTQNTDMKRET